MLRITNNVTGVECKWSLCGQLTGPWVAELRSNWQQASRKYGDRRRVVDLSDVTFIDEDGEGLLREMKKEGAVFVATGVETVHVLENLKTRGKRTLRRFLAHLPDPCRSRDDD